MLRVWISLVATIWFAATAFCQVKDSALIFRPDTAKKASSLIASIAKKHKQAVHVETFVAVPKDQIAAVAKMSDAEKSTFFNAWGRERMADLKSEGLHVLICRSPGYLQVTSGPELEKVGFGGDDSDSLTGKYLAQAKMKKIDEGLLEAIAFLDARLQHYKENPPKGNSIGERLALVKFEEYAKVADPIRSIAWGKGGLHFSANGFMRMDADRKIVKLHEVSPNSLVRKGSGEWMLVDSAATSILELRADNQMYVLAESGKVAKLRAIHDVAIDRDGNVFWSDPGDANLGKPDGRIYRLRPDGVIAIIAQKLNDPSSIAVDSGSKNLFVVESKGTRVAKMALSVAGKPSDKTMPFADLGDFTGFACKFDTNENLWIAGADKESTAQVMVLNASGKAITTLSLPAKKAAALTFGGEQGDVLFVGTEGPAAIFQARVGIPGFAGHPGVKMKAIRKVVGKAP